MKILVVTDDPVSGRFAGGPTTIRRAFEKLVSLYGVPDRNSCIIDAADPNYAPDHDIPGKSRSQGFAPDMGACEFQRAQQGTALTIILAILFGSD